MPGHTLVGKHPARHHYSIRHLAFISCPYLPAPCLWPVIQWQHGPSKQGSFTPTKGPPQTKGRTGDQVGHAHGLNRLRPGRMS